MNQDNNGADFPAPPRLVTALRHSQSRNVFVPPTVDEAVLRAAREHLVASLRPRPKGFLLWFRRVTFATACLLFLGIAYWVIQVSSERSTTFAREDINRDGRVDILDAFHLARQLQSSGEQTRDLDFNGDGMVDHSDADALATRAVSLEKGGRS